MKLVEKLDKKIWEQYKTYEDVNYFIQYWHDEDENYSSYDHWENFIISYKDEAHQSINLKATLHNMPANIVVKIAIDLGIDTPGFLPSIPKFKNILKDQNQSAYQNFDRAIKNVYEHPDMAVALASSTIEGIIKTILTHKNFQIEKEQFKNKTLSKLIATIIKEFGFDDRVRCPQEIITLASQLRGIGATVEDLRSDKSIAHGKATNDYILDDPLWASLTVNACATVGLFLWEYFEKKYRPIVSEQSIPKETTSNIENMPF